MPGAPIAAVEALVSRWLPQLRDALPGLRLAPGELAPFVAAHPRGAEWAARGGDDLGPLTELALVFALRRGERAALDLFEGRYLADLDRTLARVRLAPGELDEIKQRVRAKLLVPGAEGRLRLEEYAGLGRLGGLVQVTATREAVSLTRRHQRERPAGDASLGDRAAAEGWDAGIELGRAEYRQAFRQAFAAAVAGLEPRERNLLRMHLLGGVTLERLAVIYDVHRATVVRWLAAAREKVLDATRRGLKDCLALGSAELDSMMASAQSRLDLSVERFFATHDRGHEPGG
jgi:RNA polymerase sigma-70 factor, ECF subfamily